MEKKNLTESFRKILEQGLEHAGATKKSPETFEPVDLSKEVAALLALQNDPSNPNSPDARMRQQITDRARQAYYDIIRLF